MGKFPQDMKITQRIIATPLTCAIEDAAVWHGPVVIASELTTKDCLKTIDAHKYFDTILKPVKNAGIALMAGNKAWPVLSISLWGTDKSGKTLAEACHNEKQSVITLDSTCNIVVLDGFVKLNMLPEKDDCPARRALHQLINEMTSVTRMVYTIN